MSHSHAHLTHRGQPTVASTINAMLERLEQENPYCGVNALAIRGLPNVPTRHRVTLTLEWPVVADPPAAKGGKR